MSEVIIPPTATATRTLYIESYGCAMNFSDSEIIASIMGEHGFTSTNDELNADVIFLNTCAIRDNAEQRIRERLKHLRGNKHHRCARLHGRTIEREIIGRRKTRGYRCRSR